MSYLSLAHRVIDRSSAAVAMVALICAGGCSQTSHQSDSPATAASLNTKGVISKDPAVAKAWFQKAIAADPYFGPAYSNLGIALLREADYFDAARAFDQAIRNMPNNPEPRVYLGLVYEDAGQLDKAVDKYQQALAVAPESIDALQALTRVQVKLDRVDEKTVEALRQVAMRGTDDEWKSWARQMLLRFGAAVDTTQP